MKALVYDGIQKVDYREVTDPKIEKDDDIIVKVTSTEIFDAKQDECIKVVLKP